MKPDQLQDFIKKKGGIKSCINLLRSEYAGTVARDFVALVRSAHSLDGDELEEMKLGARPDLQVLLLNALVTGDYEHVEKHISKALNLPEEMEGIEPTVAVYPSQFADVFKSQYNGTAAANLHEHLGELHGKFVSQPGRYYAKYCSIVQSSGTGKSRALIELKDQGVIVLYFSLRSGTEGGNPYPYRDEIPAKILTEGLNCSEKEYGYRCTVFLTASLQLLKSYLLEFRKEGDTRDEIVKAWSQRMCDMGSQSRGRFFSDLRALYQKAIYGPGKAETRNDALPRESTAKLGITDRQSADKETSVVPTTPSCAESSSKDPKPNHTAPRIHSGTLLKRAYTELLDALPELSNSRSYLPSLVVAIDDAHSLCEPQKHFVPSHVLTRVISELSQTRTEAPFWFAFVSTSYKVADLSVPADFCSSSRVSIGGKRVFPPYYLFGQDQHALALRAIKPERVALFANIARFGRPLWHLLAKSNTPASQVLATASQMLCGEAGFDPNNVHHALAVIGQRFLLNFRRGSYNCVTLQQTGVSNHLRVCLWVSEDRELLETAYPSEPLLSCAAAQLSYPLANPISDDFFTQIGDALGQLKEVVLHHTVHKGLKGDLVSRLVFLIAKDVAIRTFHATPASESPTTPSLESSSVPEELLDCKPLPVTRYLSVLFGENVLDQQARDLFGGWYVNFSHWIGMDQDIAFDDPEDDPTVEFNPVTEMQEWLLCHWTRTSAVQCDPGQPSFDKVIPMCKLRQPSEPRSSEDTDASRVSFILISDRNSAEASTVHAVDNVSPGNAYLPMLDQPYIAILADLGAAEEGVTTAINGSNNALLVHASGFGPVTYPFLKGTMVGHARDILHAWNSEDDMSPGQKLLEEQVRVGQSFNVSSELLE